MNNEGKLKLAFSSAVISGMFCTVVALLLLLNYFQLSQSDPIESKALEALVERLSEDPGNEALKTEIRQFDLLARKAYFNSQWQIKTGAYLLLFGAIVLAVSLRFFYALKAKIEPPEKVPGNEIASRIMAQKGILITGAVVFVWALIASWATVNYLGRYEVGGTADTDALPAGDEAIEVIEVARDPVLAAEDTAGEKSGTPGEHAAVLPPGRPVEKMRKPLRKKRPGNPWPKRPGKRRRRPGNPEGSPKRQNPLLPEKRPLQQVN